MHSFSAFSFSSMMFSFLMVVGMLQMWLLHTSLAQVDVTVNPAQIDVGLSPSLDVNCTFSMSSSGMAALISLIVSRVNSTDLASITTVSGQVNVVSSEGITADGVIIQGGQSYIHLHWDYPTDIQEGAYMCTVSGIDIIGHSIQTFNTSVVSVKQPDVQDLVDELKQVKQTQNTWVQEIQELQAYVIQLETKMEDQLDLSSVFLFPPLNYNDKRYFVSKAGFQNYNESITICKSYGGILAEMNDYSEYHAVQNYLAILVTSHMNTMYYVYIGGTDEQRESTWVLPSTEQNLPVADWWNGQPPSSNRLDNCLRLERPAWNMRAGGCLYGSVSRHYKYMCEISN